MTVNVNEVGVIFPVVSPDAKRMEWSRKRAFAFGVQGNAWGEMAGCWMPNNAHVIFAVTS
ncbi:hypothetical protein JXA32_00240 [Candidatus Sumerlaeota bacterium]|nr:hypothetical protein [Candidatus Sumerlaeota bacterium]